MNISELGKTFDSISHIKLFNILKCVIDVVGNLFDLFESYLKKKKLILDRISITL